MTVTAKIQISATADDRVLLDETMSVYSGACNCVSDYIFRTHDLKQSSLNKVLYSTLREKFGLKSQMAQSVLKTVIARYKTILENQKEWIKPSFKKPQYDLVWNRDYSLTQNCFSVNTLSGRVKLPYFAEGMSKYFDHGIYKFGTAKLVKKHEKYFLHIPVTYDIEESNISDICNVVGIDRGINFVVATYDSKHKSDFVSGKAIKQKRAHYSKLRKDLQMRQTPSARRRLKAIGGRENRWMQDVNHQVSKALVESNPKHTLFVLEDLSGVRNATERVRTKDRYVSVSWSFYDLEQKLIYKAKQNQSTVIKVDPRYTSQCCPMCGHIEKTNRNKKIHLFTCKNCGYNSNDDRVGAMNLYRMGIGYLEEAQVPDTVTAE
jgi:IS605 OrfB family transposase